MTILLTRADNSHLKTALEDRGIQVIEWSLFNVTYIPIATLTPADALIFTSPNAVAALAHIPNLPLSTPCFAVGELTKTKLQALGFQKIITPRIHNASSLIEKIKETAERNTTLLYPHGNFISTDLKNALKEWNIEERVVYETHYANSMPADIARHIASGNIKSVALFSKKAARTFVEIVSNARLTKQLRNIVVFTISSDVSGVISSYCKTVRKFDNDTEALLRLVKEYA